MGLGQHGGKRVCQRRSSGLRYAPCSWTSGPSYAADAVHATSAAHAAAAHDDGRNAGIHVNASSGTALILQQCSIRSDWKKKLFALTPPMGVDVMFRYIESGQVLYKEC